MMLERRLGGVLEHLRRAVHGLGDQRGGHRRGDADLRLAAALGRRRASRCACTDSRSPAPASRPSRIFSMRHLPLALDQRIDDRRHHAGRAAGRRGDDQVAAGVLLRGGQGEGRDQRDRAVALVLVVLGALVDGRRLGVQLDRAGQDAVLARRGPTSRSPASRRRSCRGTR